MLLYAAFLFAVVSHLHSLLLHIYQVENLVLCSFTLESVFNLGCAAWITQLVVRKDMRHKGLVTELIAKAWKKDALAWGLMTSHPYAVRALESATRRKCDPRIISLHAKDLIKATCVVGFLFSRNVKSALLKIVL